jgi:hypothetical protein
MLDIDLDSLSDDELLELADNITATRNDRREKVRIDTQKYINHLPPRWQGWLHGNDGFMLCYNFSPFEITIIFYVDGDVLKVQQGALTAQEAGEAVTISEFDELRNSLSNLSDLNVELVTTLYRQESRKILTESLNELL